MVVVVVVVILHIESLFGVVFELYCEELKNLYANYEVSYSNN